MWLNCACGFDLAELTAVRLSAPCPKHRKQKSEIEFIREEMGRPLAQ
jgi:hypothetical protein